MNKLNKLEKSWIYYDIGNSAFIMLFTTIVPIFFNNLAGKSLKDTTYLTYWGYAITASTLIMAFLGPILGALADSNKQKKNLFKLFVFIGVISCAGLPFAINWFMFLIQVVIAKVAFNGSLVFYDSMLIDVTEEERMDNVSSQGYAWGYIGSCLPFIISIFISLKGTNFGLSQSLSMNLVFFINALWWLLWTLPLLKRYEQIYVSPIKLKSSQVFKHLLNTFKEIKNDKKVFYFLLAFLFYIDGVYTIINMATAYGKSLGLSSQGLILALLVTQLVAFPCAIFFGVISKTRPVEGLIKICIICYGIIAFYAVTLDSLTKFWILALGVGMFQGAIQALSRSYFAKIIPPEKSSEYFGIYDVFGKGASILGSLMVSVITQITNNQHYAIFGLALLFVIGLIIFLKIEKVEGKEFLQK